MKADTPASTIPEPARLAEQVVEIVEKLVIELHGPRAHATVALDDSLGRDLGLGSLERVELLLRLEEAFGVRLPDAVMAEAETVRDLARSILSAAPSVPETRPEPSAPPGPAVGAPASARTLAEVLRWHAELNPERVHIVLREDDGREQPIRYGDLWARATAVAAGLRDRGLQPRDAVGLVLRTEQERLKTEIMDRVVAAVGIPPDVVVICRPGAVLKTSSGKLRRGATREAYLSADLGRGRSVVVQWARLLIHDLGARVHRLAARAGALAYAGYVASLLAITVPALWALALLLPRGRAVDRVARGWCGAVLALARCPIRVEGLEHCAAPAVFVANHASYLDAVALLAAIPAEFRFVAKCELASTPIIGTLIRKVGHLTVERGDFSRSVADTERVTAALREGASLLFFPEGTFVRAPGLLPFKLGAFKAAVETGRPVVPVAIRGTREILPDGSWVPRRKAIVVEIAAPIAPRDRGWPEMVRLRDLARAEIARRSGEDPVRRN